MMTEQPVWFSRRKPSHDKGLEADDPYELTGIRYPVEPGVDADGETMRALIEEFALQGWDRERIVGMFADPRAGHAHTIYRRRGDPLLDGLFDEVFGTSSRSS